MSFNMLPEVSLFEAFTVRRLLKRYYSLQPSLNTSYVQVLYQKMTALKALLHVDEGLEAVPIENSEETLMNNFSQVEALLATNQEGTKKD